VVVSAVTLLMVLRRASRVAKRHAQLIVRVIGDHFQSALQNVALAPNQNFSRSP
jgi:hypothetical protein